MGFIIAGVLLDIIAVAVIAVLIFVPMLAPDTAAVNNLLDSMLCEPGETYEPRQIITQDSEGTGYSLYALCIGERGERDVTPKQTFIGIGAFLVPFLPGLGLTILGAYRIKARRERPRDVSHLFTGNRPQQQAQAPTDWMQQLVQQGGTQGKSLTDRLRDLDDAYENRLISREEYDALRRKAIDEST